MGRVHDNGGDPALWSLPEISACIESCLAVRQACLEAITTILSEKDGEALSGLVLTLVDCADICQINAGFMIRESPFHTRTCATCAEVCERCAWACTRSGVPGLVRCADACRRCAERCRHIATPM